ncbi:MAG: hypothetical protein IPN17_26935 [Deltaproteobacteria bacterium]|nr:hypothetical protein [Deltaproteobacteria bacterium]
MRRTLSLAAVLVLVACRDARPPAAVRDAAAVRVAATPTAPEGVLGRVSLARPRATAEALGERLGARVPVELLLAVGAGVPMAVLGAVDTSRPVTACAVERGATGVGWVLALTPRSAAEARAALSSRYRMVAVEGLGERAESREGARGEGVSCALVPVVDAVAARVVCATDAALLARAGRWLAWTTTAAGGGAAGEDDVVASLGEGAAPRLRARWQSVTTELLAEWSAAASEARREHDRPPDYGDPEAALGVLERARDAVGAAMGEVRGLRVAMRVGEEGVEVTTVATLPRGGTSGVAADAVARAGAGAGGAEALARWVAPDADVRAWVNTPDDGHRVLWRSAVDAAVRVLGTRVGDGVAARRTLEALGGESGEAAALGGVTRGGGSAGGSAGGEWTLVVGQRDGGRSARAALGQLATAPWVRALRWGGRGVRVTGCGAGAWCATLTGGTAAAGATGTAGTAGTAGQRGRRGRWCWR